MKSCYLPLKPSPRGALFALTLACAGLLSGCAVIAVADTAATVVVGTVGLAADAVIGTARMVLPGDDKKDKKDKK
jgi:hypothetical protein